MIENNNFKKSERLYSHKRINLLFEMGKTIKTGCLRAIYIVENEETDIPVQVLVSVPKKQFNKSVDRNLLKRKIREAYRLHKHPLVKALERENKSILLGLIYLGNEIQPYSEIDDRMVQIIIKLLDIIELETS